MAIHVTFVSAGAFPRAALRAFSAVGPKQKSLRQPLATSPEQRKWAWRPTSDWSAASLTTFVFGPLVPLWSRFRAPAHDRFFPYWSSSPLSPPVDCCTLLHLCIVTALVGRHLTCLCAVPECTPPYIDTCT